MVPFMAPGGAVSPLVGAGRDEIVIVGRIDHCQLAVLRRCSRRILDDKVALFPIPRKHFRLRRLPALGQKSWIALQPPRTDRTEARLAKGSIIKMWSHPHRPPRGFDRCGHKRLPGGAVVVKCGHTRGQGDSCSGASGMERHR
jgi:hypothetical protein